MTNEARHTEILYGIHPVAEAIFAGRRALEQVYIASGKRSSRLASILSAAQKKKIPVHELPAGKIRQMAGDAAHQGVAAQVGRYPYAPEPDRYAARADSVSPPLWVLLDGVVDPRNLGAMLRTALCAGVEGVVVPKDRAAPATPAVSRASAGALEHVRLVRVTNLARTIEAMKKDGCWIAGLDAGAEQSLFAADLSGPLGLVVGGEGRGLRSLVKRCCDFLVRIPQRGPVGSLNASAAGAVAVYEAFRQRNRKRNA